MLNMVSTLMLLSTASAITTGLAAYYLSLARSGQLPDSAGFENTPKGLKDYIIKHAWVRSQEAGVVPGVWNGVTKDMQDNACRWDPNAQLTRRLRRRGDSCPLPNPSSTSSSSSSGSATRTPTPAITATLTEQDTVCAKKSEKSGGGDIDFPRHVDFATKFCNGAQKASQYIYPPGRSAASGFQATVDDSHGTNYTYMVQWVDGCATMEEKLDILKPAGANVQRSCQGYMVSNLKFCKYLCRCV